MTCNIIHHFNFDHYLLCNERRDNHSHALVKHLGLNRKIIVQHVFFNKVMTN